MFYINSKAINRRGMMKLTKKSIIIIGGGLGGLSTGCYAQLNGFSSQIYEQHSVPGGLAAAWERKGYIIDGGIHFITGHKPDIAFYEILREVGADKAHFVDMTTYAKYIDESSGHQIEITSDLNRLERELKDLFPMDITVVKELLSGARAMAKRDLSDAGFQKPVELMGWRDKAGEMWGYRGLWRYMSGKFAKPVREYVEKITDPVLRDLILYMFLPEVPVWFIQMILGMLSAGQMGLLEEGSREFVRAIEKYYLELGGELTCKSTIEEILVQNDRAIGVRMVEGDIHMADYVVSAVDGYHTIYELLGGQYVNEAIETRYRTWKLSPPYMAISYGVAREIKEEPWLTLIKMEKPLQIVNTFTNYLTIRIFNYSSSFAPPGKTVVQVSLETDWNDWYELREDRSQYKGEKERIATEVLSRLEQLYPGILLDVEVTDVATPYTYWRYTRNREGSIMGWTPTPDAMSTQLKKTLPGLTSFYMAGQWAMPTGGVSSAIYSGRHVIQLICHQEGKPFTTTG